MNIYATEPEFKEYLKKIGEATKMQL